MTPIQPYGRRNGGAHLLRRLPPSCGEPGSMAEVKYFIEVVTIGDKILKPYDKVVECSHMMLRKLLICRVSDKKYRRMKYAFARFRN